MTQLGFSFVRACRIGWWMVPIPRLRDLWLAVLHKCPEEPMWMVRR